MPRDARPTPPGTGRILVIRGGALGDFILMLPVLAALRRQFPAIRLEVLGYPHIAQLARVGGLADAVHPIEARPLAGFFARHGDLDPATSHFFAGFALIISFLYDPDGIFRANVASCSRAQFIAGPYRPDPILGRHATDTFLRPLEQLAVFDADPTPRLSPEPLATGPGRWLAAHPGSGSEAKNWLEARWARLLGRVVQETSHGVLLVGGEAEGDRLERLAAGLPAGRVQIARSRPIEEVARRLRGCDQFIGHDSGVTHLAAAVGIPCTVLWGPSDLALWRPRGDGIVVIESGAGLEGITTDCVWHILRQRLETPGSPSPPTSDKLERP